MFIPGKSIRPSGPRLPIPNNKTHNLRTYIESWIRTLHKKKTQSLINHGLGERFTLSRCIRRGCSLFPHLYILTLEPLLENIRKNTLGIDLPGFSKAKLVAYENDTIFLVSANSQIVKIMDIFHFFGKGSSSTLNITKKKKQLRWV